MNSFSKAKSDGPNLRAVHHDKATLQLCVRVLWCIRVLKGVALWA